MTVLLAIDPLTEQNGCTVLFPGDHRRGALAPPGETGYPLPDSVVDDAHAVPLELQPGDVAIFGCFVPHRSAPNRSSRPRRALYLSYNAASEGGNQRDRHYAEFHAWIRKRLSEEESQRLFFR
jgi:ectoine hydroxylase-related dioxygenase (phytanoyl-CoA dioxygenase family)